MFQRVLFRMRGQVRRRHYVVTYHARKEMNDEDLSVYDLEQVILAGRILERQRDRETGELKYRIRGRSSEGVDVEVIAKLSPTGRLVIITVYAV